MSRKFKPIGLAILVEGDDGQLYLMRTTDVRWAEVVPGEDERDERDGRGRAGAYRAQPGMRIQAEFGKYEVIVNDYFDEEQVRRAVPRLGSGGD
jgi:hypothetical protein